jgi:hypothetical protein
MKKEKNNKKSKINKKNLSELDTKMKKFLKKIFKEKQILEYKEICNKKYGR